MAIRLCLTFVILLVFCMIVYPCCLTNNTKRKVWDFVVKLLLVGIALSGIYYVWMEM